MSILSLRHSTPEHVYARVRAKLTLAQIAEVAMHQSTHDLTEREIDAVLHVWGLPRILHPHRAAIGATVRVDSTWKETP